MEVFVCTILVSLSNLESENFDIKLLGEERRVSPGLSELEIWSREAVGESPMETMEFDGIHGSDKGG